MQFFTKKGYGRFSTTTSASLQVAADLLHVRSGPGLNQSSVQQLGKDTVVTVDALSREWCFTQLDENTSGWINGTYTTVLPG